MPRTAIRLIITGRVQGVGFRFWAERKATALGLDGWVRNLPDGRVEALIAGPVDAVGEMAAACRLGPRMARVKETREFNADAPAATGFRQVR